jgi:serine/threonine protein phosphatase PrpC
MGQSQSRVKEYNQDAYVAHTSYIGSDQVHLFAVFDGHGEDGHKVTEYLKSVFPKELETITFHYLRGFASTNDVKEGLKSVFLKIQEELCAQLGVDTESSGSTAVVALLIRDDLFCASVGDSRAVLGLKSRPWRVLPLTRDHKPESPRENARITLKRGRIETKYLPNKAAFGPMRVWLPTRDSPGLAMSRSLGDAEVHEYGVSAEPDVTYRKLRSNDRLLLLASDGIWNFMSNEEAVALSFRFYDKRDASRAAESLAAEARRRWRLEGEAVDDITVVTVFIN